jgi:hypothetical protein
VWSIDAALCFFYGCLFFPIESSGDNWWFLFPITWQIVVYVVGGCAVILMITNAIDRFIKNWRKKAN